MNLHYMLNKIFVLMGMMTTIFIKCQSNTELLRILDKKLTERAVYINKKHHKIKVLKENLQKHLVSQSTDDIFLTYTDLFNEYKSFKYDSAYYYVTKAKDIAELTKNPEFINQVRINEAFILTSSGLFKEAIDTLKAINTEYITPKNRFDYYIVRARTYYDLADYNKDERFSIHYIQTGNSLLDSAKLYAKPNSNEWMYAETLGLMKKHRWKEAKNLFEKWLNNCPPKYYGIAASSLGYIYSEDDTNEKTIHYLAKAAISDIENATMETVALRNLANELYRKGDLEKANEYISIAMDDATYYDARHRKFEISKILPIIEKAKIKSIDKKNQLLKRVVFFLSALSLIIIVFLFVIFKQLKQKSAAKKAIADSFEKLEEMNLSLTEVNNIKEEYIAYFISALSGLINKIDSLQKIALHKIRDNKPSEAINLLKRYNVNQEREQLFTQFDEIFIKLFPTYINEFAALFPKDQLFPQKKKELLSTEQRIFALHRLGIQNPTQIADFMNLSVSTIYTYKTRIKSRSLYRDNFENKIMEIKSF